MGVGTGFNGMISSETSPCVGLSVGLIVGEVVGEIVGLAGGTGRDAWVGGVGVCEGRGCVHGLLLPGAYEVGIAGRDGQGWAGAGGGGHDDNNSLPCRVWGLDIKRSAERLEPKKTTPTSRDRPADGKLSTRGRSEGKLLATKNGSGNPAGSSWDLLLGDGLCAAVVDASNEMVIARGQDGACGCEWGPTTTAL